MPFHGIRVGHLQALCRRGRHDIAEVHDTPQDVQYLPPWLRARSFLEGNGSINILKTGFAPQRNNGEPSATRISPSGTPNADSNVSLLPIPGASEISNHHGAYTATWYAVCSHCHVILNHYIGLCPSATGVAMACFPSAVPQTYIPGMYQQFGYQPTHLNTRSKSRRTSASLFSANGESGTTSVPRASSGSQQRSGPSTEHDPRNPIDCLEGCACHISIFVHTSFQVWEFAAVQVVRSVRCLAVTPVPAPATASDSPNCGRVIETVRYLRARDDGMEGIPPLPEAIPGAPMLPKCDCDSGRHSIPKPPGADNYRYCSVDIFLGSMEGNGDVKHFSNVNNKMHLNQMIELQLDVESLARRVAVALALMHWSTNIDANGVKFYLHSTWQMSGREKVLLEIGSDVSLRSFTTLQVGNFDKVNLIKMDDNGVHRAVEAVKQSRFIPMPNKRLSIQKRTWDAFVSSYIGASDIILRAKGKHLRLPRMFIHQIIQEEPSWN